MTDYFVSNYGQSPPPSLSPTCAEQVASRGLGECSKEPKLWGLGKCPKESKLLGLGKMFKRIKELRFENVLSKPTKELSWILCHLSWHHSWQGSAPVTHLRAHKFSNFCVNGGGGSWRYKKRRKDSEILHLPVASSLYHSRVPMDKIMIDPTQF